MTLGTIDRRSRELRALPTVLVSVLVLGALCATGLLIDALIHGGVLETNSASDLLLEAGSIVWLSNIASRCSIGSWTEAGRPPARTISRSMPILPSPSS